MQVTKVEATDTDNGKNGQISYELGEGAEKKFYIDSKGNVSYFKKKLFFA